MACWAPGKEVAVPWFERVPESEYQDRVADFWNHVLGNDETIQCIACFNENWLANPGYCPRGQKLHDQAYCMDIGGPDEVP